MTKEKTCRSPVAAADRWLCLLIALAVGLTAVFCLSRTSLDWGDDHAAYLNEAFAIADGCLEEQTKLNYIMHPSKLPAESDGELMYVWSFPLLLAAVYKLAGYDRTDFHTLIDYKLPSAILLGLASAMLFLFFRRRFGRKTSLAASLAFGLSYEFISFVDQFILTEMLFLFCFTAAFWLIDVYLAEKNLPRRMALGAILGAVFWLTYETRLNGVTIVAAFFVGQAVQMLREKRRGERKSGRELAAALVPYAVFAALVLLSRLVLPEATSNMSDFRSEDLLGTLLDAGRQLYYYLSKMCVWLGSLVLRVGSNEVWPHGFIIAGVLLSLAAAWGVIRGGWRENLHLTLLFAGTVAGTSFLPYWWQGLRYMYGVLPIAMLFALCGLRDLAGCAARHAEEKGRRFPQTDKKPWVPLAVTAALCLYAFLPAAAYAAEPKTDTGPFSTDAKAVWNYIREETPADSTVFFAKPRMLYLNTGRVSVGGWNGHSPAETEYYLACAELSATELPEEYAGAYHEVYRRGAFVLYEKN